MDFFAQRSNYSAPVEKIILQCPVNTNLQNYSPSGRFVLETKDVVSTSRRFESLERLNSYNLQIYERMDKIG
jgi:hypothetical protein